MANMQNKMREGTDDGSKAIAESYNGGAPDNKLNNMKIIILCLL